MAGIGRRDYVSIGEPQWRIAFQGCVAACRGGVGLELGKLPFQITGIPERHIVQKFSPHRPDQSFDERI
jgi:hypothetical protein